MVDMFISREEMMDAPPIFRDSYLKGLEDGQKEVHKEKVRMILKVLSIRFPLIPYDHDAIHNLLQPLTKDTLEQALEKVISSSNLTDFKNWLYEHQQKDVKS